MNKKRKIFILFIGFVGGTVLFLNGCEKPKIIYKESLGTILDAIIIPTSFNEFPKMSIKTEKAIVTISIVSYIPLGEEAWYLEFSNGTRRLTWNGSQYSYTIR